MSSIARSNKTLSGCLVSLVIGSSYFLRRKLQEVKRPAIMIATRKCFTISTLPYPCYRLNLQEHGLAGRALQIGERPTGVGSVKNRRPCHQPVTPGAGDLSGVFGRHPAIDLDG